MSVADAHPSTDIIPGFTRSDRWREKVGISQRHEARLREQGLPYMRAGKWIWISNEGARDFFEKRTVGLKRNGRAVRP